MRMIEYIEIINLKFRRISVPVVIKKYKVLNGVKGDSLWLKK
jgi:hypothetical protein